MVRLSLMIEMTALVAAPATNSMLLVSLESRCPDCCRSR